MSGLMAAQPNTKEKIPSISVRNFFETSHGKSVCDGLGAMKNSCSRAVVSGKIILSDAKAVYSYCQQNLTQEKKNSREW